MAAAIACNSHRVAPSLSIRSTLIDMDIQSLEIKLQLLDAQRQLSALRCENFIQILESEIGRSTSAPRAIPSRRASFDLGSGRSAPARLSRWEEDLSFYESSAASGSSTSSRRRLHSGATPPPSRRHSSATASRKALRRYSSLTTNDAAAF